MVERHVLQGRKHIARQLEIIEELRLKGHPTGEAARLLVLFENLQRQHQAHLERLQQP